MPSLSLTACTIRCREPRYLSVVSTDRCPKQELNLLKLSTG
jgi:hypothetical protein